MRNSIKTLSVFLCVCGQNLYAQSWTYYPLANNNVNTIAIDSKGNKWFGISDGGAASFDGTNWVFYDTTNGLPNMDVQEITIDTKDNVWFSTGVNLSKFDGKNWEYYNTKSGFPGFINSMTVDNQGNPWVTSGNSVSTYNGVNWIAYDTISNDIAIDNKGNKWLGSQNGLSMFDGSKFAFYPFPDSMKNQFVWRIAIDSKNQVWFTTPVDGHYGLDLFDGKNWH